MFNQLVVSSVHPSGTHRRWTIAFSGIAQALLLGTLILVPLMYTEALPDAMLKTMIVAPPPPPPLAPAPQIRAAGRARVIALRNIVAPTHIPSGVSIDPGGPPVVYADDRTATDTIGDAFLSAIVRPPTQPSPPAEERQQRIPVGGNIQEALLIHRVLPEYPPIARTAHVSGTVVLHAIIGKDGTVRELMYVSGPALLIRAAMDAVRQWRYQPTLLNQVPVEVDTTIEVVFNLGN
jgi:protein TonB